QPNDGLQYVQALSSDLVAQGDTYQVVISNHLVHQLNDDALQGLLRDSQQLATRRAIHSDIRRSRVAYTLFSIGTWPLFPGSFIRQDGLASIRRSYTAAELRAVAAFGWRVIPPRPWRNLLLYDAIDHENSRWPCNIIAKYLSLVAARQDWCWAAYLLCVGWRWSYWNAAATQDNTRVPSDFTHRH